MTDKQCGLTIVSIVLGAIALGGLIAFLATR